MSLLLTRVRLLIRSVMREKSVYLSYAGEICVSLKNTTVNDVCPETRRKRISNSSSTGLKVVTHHQQDFEH